jgi:isoprene-epoxide---glutathione S-transferase
MRTIQGYIPAWGQACISPYVSKACYFLKMSGLDYQFESMSLPRLKNETPRGKLPVLIEEDGTKVHDSNAIIAHVRARYGDKLDADLSAEQQAVSVAFDRLLGEHLYWSGVIEPRWRQSKGWETYIPYIVGGAAVSPEIREALDDFRQLILSEHLGQGMGRRPAKEIFEVFKTDLDAVSDYLGDKPFFLGARPHWIDAAVYSHVGHVTFVPFDWAGRAYAQSKKNLVNYLHRMREQFYFPALTGK